MDAKDQTKWQEILEAHGGDQDKAAETYIRYKCLTDVYFLATEILGLNSASEGRRQRLDPKFHKWLAGKLDPNKDTLILVQRGGMKSTFSKMKVIQLILQDPLRRVALISRTSGLVEEQLGDIKRLLSTPLLRRYFPDIIPEPGKRYSNWQRSTVNELTMVRRESWGRIPQENQIEAWGMGATITGRHYDIVVLDDPINEQTCSTPEQIQKARDYFSYLQAILEPDGFMLVVGTRYHHADLFGTIIKHNWFGRRVYKRQAIEEGKSTYKFFTIRMLEKIKTRVGPFVWSCQYMNNPIPQEFQIFPPPQPVFAKLPEDEYEYYITVDPAATVEEYSDDTALVVCAMNRAEKLFVIEALALREPANRIAEILVEKIVHYRPKKVGVEFGLQTALRYIIDVKLSEYRQRTGETFALVMESIKIPRNLSKAERINRSLGAFVREGRLMVQESLNELMLQMEYFPRGERDDLVDATSMQLQLIDKFRGGYWVQPMDQLIGKHTFFDLFGDPDKAKEVKSWEEHFVA